MAERIDGRKRYEVEYAINSGGSGGGGGGGSGTVTSVALSAPTGLTVGGSPVTSSGTLALTFTAGYSIPTTAKQTNWDTAYTATSGLGNSATRNVGTTAGTVAAGDDSRFVTDHGLLTGLADDDHSQYVLASGARSGWPVPTTAAAANGVPKADANGRIAKEWLPEASIDDFQKAGTTNYTAFYPAGATTGTALTAATLTANRLYAIPFLSPRRGARIDQLSAYVTTGVSSTNIRFGIYNNTSESALYPATLFYDAGAFTSTTTNQSRDATALSLTLEPSKIYWCVIVSSGAPSVRGIAAGGGSYIMGVTATNVSAMTLGVYSTFTYAALPATFPTTGFTASTANHPTLFYRYSS